MTPPSEQSSDPPDLMAALEESLCERIHGHEWVDAGGGMQICARCEATRETPEAACDRCKPYPGDPCVCGWEHL